MLHASPPPADSRASGRARHLCVVYLGAYLGVTAAASIAMALIL
jgi:hypothetical protein